MNLLDLPDDILERITGFLDCRELIFLSLTNKLAQSAIYQNPAIWISRLPIDAKQRSEWLTMKKCKSNIVTFRNFVFGLEKACQCSDCDYWQYSDHCRKIASQAFHSFCNSFAVVGQKRAIDKKYKYEEEDMKKNGCKRNNKALQIYAKQNIVDIEQHMVHFSQIPLCLNCDSYLTLPRYLTTVHDIDFLSDEESENENPFYNEEVERDFGPVI